MQFTKEWFRFIGQTKLHPSLHRSCPIQGSSYSPLFIILGVWIECGRRSRGAFLNSHRKHRKEESNKILLEYIPLSWIATKKNPVFYISQSICNLLITTIISCRRRVLQQQNGRKEEKSQRSGIIIILRQRQFGIMFFQFLLFYNIIMIIIITIQFQQGLKKVLTDVHMTKK